MSDSFCNNLLPIILNLLIFLDLFYYILSYVVRVSHHHVMIHASCNNDIFVSNIVLRNPAAIALHGQPTCACD